MAVPAVHILGSKPRYIVVVGVVTGAAIGTVNKECRSGDIVVAIVVVAAFAQLSPVMMWFPSLVTPR